MKEFKKCGLCGKEGNLSYEHIPPKAAFNSKPIRTVSAENMLTNSNRLPWDIKGVRYENQQKGMGYKSLCEVCNNNTGSWYGEEFAKMAGTIHNALKSKTDEEYDAITVEKLHPLRFVKQVVAMFCGINDPDNKELDELRTFVLDKNAVGLNKKKFKICMYMTRSQHRKYAGYSVAIIKGEDKLEMITLSEITAYPFGFILYFDPQDNVEYIGVDIMTMADCQYDDECNVNIPLCVKDVNTMWPLDYRSKEEIEECIKRNQEVAQGLNLATEVENQLTEDDEEIN